jgi:hypothetical protein
MLKGVLGEGEINTSAHWRSQKFTDHWEEEEEGVTPISTTASGPRMD